MQKLGYRCFIFYPDPAGKSIKEEIHDGITIVRCPAKKLGIHGFYNLDVLKRYDIQYAQIDSDNQLFAPNAISYCLRNKIRFYNYMGTMSSDSDNKVKKSVSDLLMKRNIHLYKRTKCFVKTNEVLKRATAAGIKDVQIVHVGLDFSAIPNVDEDKETIRKKAGLPLDKRIVLFIGRMDPYKRPEQMIEVMKKLDDSYYGVMIGTGSLTEEIDRAIADSLGDRIKRIDRIANSDIHRFYKVADYFLNFNEKEIFGMSMLEAMYQGCNVIAISSPGACEIIDESSGFIVENVDQMVSVIKGKDFKDPEMIIKRIRDEFSWDQSVKTFDSYLNA